MEQCRSTSTLRSYYALAHIQESNITRWHLWVKQTNGKLAPRILKQKFIFKFMNEWMNHFCTCRIFSVSLHVLLLFLVNATTCRDCRNNRFIIYKRELQNASRLYSAEDDSPLSHSASPLRPQRIMAPHAQPKATARKQCNLQYKLWIRNTIRCLWLLLWMWAYVGPEWVLLVVDWVW